MELNLIIYFRNFNVFIPTIRNKTKYGKCRKTFFLSLNYSTRTRKPVYAIEEWKQGDVMHERTVNELGQATHSCLSRHHTWSACRCTPAARDSRSAPRATGRTASNACQAAGPRARRTPWARRPSCRRSRCPGRRRRGRPRRARRTRKSRRLGRKRWTNSRELWTATWRHVTRSISRSSAFSFSTTSFLFTSDFPLTFPVSTWFH